MKTKSTKKKRWRHILGIDSLAEKVDTRRIMSDPSVFIWQDDGKTRMLRVFGRRLLVRRCKADASKYLIGEATGAVPSGIPAFLVQTADEHLAGLEGGFCNFCEVLAVGPRCGTPLSDKEKDEAKKARRAKESGWNALDNPVRPGDFVVVPDASTFARFRGVTGAEYDLMIDERDCIAVVAKEDLA